MHSSTLGMILAGLAAAGCLQADILNFEDLPVGTTVNAQYGPRGVIFQNAYLDSDTHASSGTHVLRSIPPTAEVFTPAPLVIQFPSPQTHIALHAGNFQGGGAGTLKVFGAGNAVLGQDGPKTVPSSSFATLFEVRLSAPGIVRAEFQIDGAALESIDDLVFEGGTVVQNPPPTVTVTSPAEGLTMAPGPVSIQGTVTGNSVLSPITVRIILGVPPDSSAPPSDNAVTLTGSGSVRTF
jgi:hypothetical protein